MEVCMLLCLAERQSHQCNLPANIAPSHYLKFVMGESRAAFPLRQRAWGTCPRNKSPQGWVGGNKASAFLRSLLKCETATSGNGTNRNNSARAAGSDARPSSPPAAPERCGRGRRLLAVQIRASPGVICITRLKSGDCSQLSPSKLQARHADKSACEISTGFSCLR